MSKLTEKFLADMSDVIENHIIDEDRPSLSQLEERLIIIRAKEEAISNILDVIVEFRDSAERLEFDEKVITNFYDYLCGELLDAETENEITTNDLRMESHRQGKIDWI